MEAIKKTPPPDIIFLDINMPHINGWDCLRALKSIAQLKKIPIVMYSTSSKRLVYSKKFGSCNLTSGVGCRLMIRPPNP